MSSLYPKKIDWIMNPWRAYGDLNIARNAVAIIKRPREAYVGQLAMLRGARLQRNWTPWPMVIIATIAGAGQATEMVREHDTERKPWSFVEIGSMFAAFGAVEQRLKCEATIRASSEVMQVIRSVHPDREMEFDELERFYEQEPEPFRMLDRKAIAARTTAVKRLEKRLQQARILGEKNAA
jgi:hypothetical protein